MKEIDPHLPIDKIAARVVSKVSHLGRVYKPTDKIYSLIPLPTIPWPYARKDDMTGRVSGRFTVIGYALWRPKSHQPNNVRWVCRCYCGRYGMLTTKAVKKNHPNTMCDFCKSINKS